MRNVVRLTLAIFCLTPTNIHTAIAQEKLHPIPPKKANSSELPDPNSYQRVLYTSANTICSGEAPAQVGTAKVKNTKCPGVRPFYTSKNDTPASHRVFSIRKSSLTITRDDLTSRLIGHVSFDFVRHQDYCLEKGASYYVVLHLIEKDGQELASVRFYKVDIFNTTPRPLYHNAERRLIFSAGLVDWETADFEQNIALETGLWDRTSRLGLSIHTNDSNWVLC